MTGEGERIGDIGESRRICVFSFDFEMDSRPSKTKHSRKIETVEPAVEVEMTCRPTKMLLLFATTRSGSYSHQIKRPAGMSGHRLQS